MIVWGARKVGKTYLVQEIFAKTYYKDNYIYVDCKKEDEIAKKAYDSKQPLDGKIHELAMEQVYKYLLVGGMPEAVEAYIDDNNLLESREILKALYDNYLFDMEMYQASQEAALRSCVLVPNIYKELNKESKTKWHQRRFVYIERERKHFVGYFL